MLGLAALGVTRNQPPLLEAGFRLTVLVLASGAVSGAVYDATRAMRGRGALARAASWWLVGGIAAALLLGALRVFLLPLLAPGSTDATYAMYITGPAGFKFLGAGVLLFGWAMADATADAALPGARIAGSGHALTVVALVSIVWAIGNLAGSPPAGRALPENAVEARRMIADATRDARANPDDGQAQFAYGLCLMYLKRNAEARPVLARA